MTSGLEQQMERDLAEIRAARRASGEETEKKTLSMGDAARALSMSVDALEREIRRGSIMALTIGGDRVVPKSEVARRTRKPPPR